MTVVHGKLEELESIPVDKVGQQLQDKIAYAVAG